MGNNDGFDHVFNLAADMGGMGFIQSNHSVIMYNNTMISFNKLEAARISGVKRFDSDSCYGLIGHAICLFMFCEIPTLNASFHYNCCYLKCAF